MHYFTYGTVVRHLYAIFFGILIQLYIYGHEILHVVLLTGIAHALMALLKRDQQQKFVMAWVFAYLAYSHL